MRRRLRTQDIPMNNCKVGSGSQTLLMISGVASLARGHRVQYVTARSFQQSEIDGLQYDQLNMQILGKKRVLLGKDVKMTLYFFRSQ